MSAFLPTAYSVSCPPPPPKSSSSPGKIADAPAWCTTFCPAGDGLISTALIQRSSVRPESTVHSGHQSGPTAGTVTSTALDTIRSGVPIVQRSFGNVRGDGISAGFPCGEPASTHLTIVSISASVNDG